MDILDFLVTKQNLEMKSKFAVDNNYLVIFSDAKNTQILLCVNLAHKLI